nr:MAG TPA: hypothetical protein [Caudoviricetes sp.]
MYNKRQLYSCLKYRYLLNHNHRLSRWFVIHLSIVR